MKRLLGYARVSTEDQNLDRQIDQLITFGVVKEDIYLEKITGTKRDRPQLIRLLSDATQGDTIVITDLTRISRSTKDLISLVEELKSKGINFKSLKESWVDTTTAQGNLMFTIMAGLAQFERDLISERTKEGLKSARARGRIGGRKSKLDDNKKKAIYDLYQAKETAVIDICKMFDITKPTLYKAIEEVSKTK